MVRSAVRRASLASDARRSLSPAVVVVVVVVVETIIAFPTLPSAPPPSALLDAAFVFRLPVAPADAPLNGVQRRQARSTTNNTPLDLRHAFANAISPAEPPAERREGFMKSRILVHFGDRQSFTEAGRLQKGAVDDPAGPMIWRE